MVHPATFRTRGGTFGERRLVYTRSQACDVLGASACEEWCVRVASLMMKGELQTFKANQVEDAWESVKS
jgi:hypothetical protein